MVELDPSRTPEIVAKVKARRKEQETIEAAEKAQLVAAKINATALRRLVPPRHWLPPIAGRAARDHRAT